MCIYKTNHENSVGVTCTSETILDHTRDGLKKYDTILNHTRSGLDKYDTYVDRNMEVAKHMRPMLITTGKGQKYGINFEKKTGNNG